MQTYHKVHKETMRSELRMEIVQQSMEMDTWEIKEKLAERREQMRIRAYEEDKRLTTKVPTKPIQNTPLFEENSRQSFSSDEVKKEVKDISFKGALVIGSEVADGYGGENLPQTDNILMYLNSEDISACIGSRESTNNQENRITIGTGDQSRILKKDVPSHGPRRQQLGGLIFGAEVEIPVGFDLRTFEGLYYDLSKGQKRRTWNPGITYHQSGRKILSGLINNVSQHFELIAYRHAKRIVQRRVWDPRIT
ncbi:hypothetical protein Tco_1186047 [Tanacetum coccineum]